MIASLHAGTSWHLSPWQPDFSSTSRRWYPLSPAHPVAGASRAGKHIHMLAPVITDCHPTGSHAENLGEIRNKREAANGSN